jgi:hypothetical protein
MEKKPGRKPGRKPVSIALRRHWLRLNEEDGLSPQEIAEKEIYDIRTVRKALDLARSDREQREASVMVFRDVKQKHYEDLTRYASKLNNEIQQESLSITKDRYFDALKEHLPRSPIWEGLEKFISLSQEIQSIKNTIRTDISGKVREIVRDSDDLYPERISEAIIYTIMNPSNAVEITSTRTAPGFFGIHEGDYTLGIISEDHLNDTIKKIENIVEKIKNSKDGINLKNKYEECTLIKEKISEELATIVMKRIVSGKCKYCPF